MSFGKSPRTLNADRLAALWRWLAVLGLLLAAAPTWALNPARRLTQYPHIAWRLQDGTLSSPPAAMAQTRDGYMWITTASGVLRFDGARFVPWQPAGLPEPPTALRDLTAGFDGSLWMLGSDEVLRWSRGVVRTIPGDFFTAIPARGGGVWGLRINRTPPMTVAVCYLRERATRCLNHADGLPGGLYQSIAQGSSGDLWLGAEASLVHWASGSATVYALPALKPHFGIGIGSIALARDGSVWFGSPIPGRGLGLQHLANGVIAPYTRSHFDSSTLPVTALFLDSRNALWIGTTQGLYRIYHGSIDQMRSSDGLSGDYVVRILEDHEGSIWAVTTTGIDSFHDARVISFSEHQGLSVQEPDVLAAGRDGTVWVGGDSLDSLNGDYIAHIRLPGGPVGTQFTALLQDHTGALWIGVDQTLVRYAHGRFGTVLQRDGSPTGTVRDLAEDSVGDIWAVGVGPSATLMRIRGLTVQKSFPDSVIPLANSITLDRHGVIWLGLYNGALARFRDGHIEEFHFAATKGTAVRQLTIGPHGSIVGATDRGVIAWKNGTQRTLNTATGLPCDGIFTLIFDAQGALWLYTPCGLLQIAPAELNSWWTHSGARLRARVFDSYDGADPARAPFRSAARTPDGRLWFINQRTLQTIDPAHLAGNLLAPPVHIDGIIADRRRYAVGDGLRLPALTRDLEIDFTALSFIAPAKVRFRYKLEGHDPAWHDWTARRQAFYTDLPPGKYYFRVIATNNDGVVNTNGASLRFGVAPAWYQTYWCWGLSAAIAGLLGWYWYRWRMHRVARALAARFDERLAERTRLARELHDTLLQTIQGSKMVADDALDVSKDPAEVRQALARLTLWLARAVDEGRDALNSLRTSTTETNDLAAALRRAVEECRTQYPVEASFSVSGPPREMHPIVRDEIYRIAYEAIRNACVHSQGTRLEVSLEYSNDLSLRVSDDGVGMDPRVADHGKESHFGLQGMRERATRIGAHLTVLTSPDTGTEVMLLVPGRVVFRTLSRSPFNRVRDMLRAGKAHSTFSDSDH